MDWQCSNDPCNQNLYRFPSESAAFRYGSWPNTSESREYDEQYGPRDRIHRQRTWNGAWAPGEQEWMPFLVIELKVDAERQARLNAANFERLEEIVKALKRRSKWNRLLKNHSVNEAFVLALDGLFEQEEPDE